jgi:hypothetical protein
MLLYLVVIQLKPNESTSYNIPFQGPGLPAGYAKFYIFIRNMVPATQINCSILNPGGSTFNSWTYNCNNSYNGSYWCWSKLLPTTTGTYTFNATYNGVTCTQSFDIINPVGVGNISDFGQFQIYPNPSDGNFTIKTGNENTIFENPTIEVFNLLGEKVYSAILQSRDAMINLSAEPDGVYFLNIITEKEIKTQKLIIQK